MARSIPDPTGPTPPLESQEVGQATPVSWTRVPGKGDAQVIHRVTTIPELVRHIRTDESLKQGTATLKGLLAPDGSKTDLFKKAKAGLEAIMPAVCAPAGTPVKGMQSGSLPGDYHSGRYGYDVDKGALELARVRADLMKTPSVEMVGTSSSGSGLWCVVRGPKLSPGARHAEYRANWEAIKDRLPGSAQVATSGESHNINRLRFIVHDPDLCYNPAAVPMEIPPFSFKAKTTPAAPAAGGKRNSGKVGNRQKQAATDVEEMQAALDHLAQVKVGEDDEKLLAVGMCMKARGHSFEEFNAWAVRAGCICSNLPSRWNSFHAADTSYSAILGIAVNTGWKKPRGGARSGAGRPEEPGSERSARRGQQSRADLDNFSASCLIKRISNSKSVIHWQGEFWQKRNGGPWVAQEDVHFRKSMRKHVLEQWETGLDTISNAAMSTYIQSLKDEVAPPCTDAFLLKPLDRTLNYHLDTGLLLPGASFLNVTVSISDGKLKIAKHRPRDFFSAVRPYDFPKTEPDRPGLFDRWLEERQPNPETRQAVWELLGGVVLKMLYEDEVIGAFCGPGGTGKGVAIGVAEMLAGEANVMAVSGGPPRLVTSQFALSQLGEGRDLLTLGDMPQAPGNGGRAAVAMAEWQKGSAILKSITGSGRIPVEAKSKNQKTLKPRVSVLIDSNFSWDWMRTDAESDSWYRRVVFVPFNEQIPAGENVPNYIDRFTPEIPQIAWYAAQAFLDKRRRGAFTWSREMRAYQSKVFTGVGAGKGLQSFLELLVPDPTSRFIGRTDIRKAAEAHTGGPVSKAVAKRIYDYVDGLPGVTPVKNRVDGYAGLRVESRV